MAKSLLALPLLASCAFAEMPGIYKTVDRALWVVKDLDRVTDAWRKIGLSEIREVGEMTPKLTYRGQPVEARLHVAQGRIGNVQIVWIQPLSGDSAYSDFLAAHGDGIMSLVHRVPTLDALNAEVERLSRLNVEVLQRSEVITAAGPLIQVLMDTEAKGGYPLGLYYAAAGFTPDEVPAKPGGPKLVHFAPLGRDIHARAAYWSTLGFPAMTYTHDAMRDPVYRGKPGKFDMELGWQRAVAPALEWIQSYKGPSVYEEALANHGECIHHLGLQVSDMDKAIAAWKELGYGVTQSGAWGEAGKAGSGRFAYLDTDAIGGVVVELLWNF